MIPAWKPPNLGSGAFSSLASVLVSNMLCLGLLLPAASVAADLVNAVIASSGTLPLILTVPHDGDEALAGVRVRDTGVRVRDTGTRQLAERTASVLEAKTGRRPYLVIARFSRSYLDANRSRAGAMQSPNALLAYQAYHDRIAAYVAEVAQRYPAGAVLVDIHGQSGDPQTIFRGTRSGLTTTRLLGRVGPVCLQGKRSITGLLAARSYRVDPTVDAESLDEDPRYRGGFTVLNYGSQRPGGVDAIQLEFGKTHRDSARFPEDLAEALLAFLVGCAYLDGPSEGLPLARFVAPFVQD